MKKPKVWRGSDNEAWLFQHKPETEHNLQCKGPKSLISKHAQITEPNAKTMLISISDKLSPQKFNKAGSDYDKYILTS